MHIQGLSWASYLWWLNGSWPLEFGSRFSFCIHFSNNHVTDQLPVLHLVISNKRHWGAHHLTKANINSFNTRSQALPSNSWISIPAFNVREFLFSQSFHCWFCPMKLWGKPNFILTEKSHLMNWRSNTLRHFLWFCARTIQESVTI